MKRLILLLLLVGLLLIPLSRPTAAYDPLCTQRQNGVCVQGPCATAQDSPACKQDAEQQTAKGNPNPIAGPTGVLQTITNIMALLSGIIAVIMIIVSGFTFVTAGGAVGGQRSGDNPTRAKKARATLMSAVIGLIIVALSWSFVTFIVQRFIQ